ncbi:MAG: hypothetical protein H7333_11535 [Bdellovibrionales bacterium]|nr:hypothetical protein [Oligoflexia bacterium]
MLKFILIILLLNLTSFASAKDLEKTSFVLFDAGETLSFLPVMQELRQRGTPFNVLALATSKTIMKDCAECLDLSKDCGVKTEVDSKISHTIEPFTSDDLSLILACLNPSHVVTGAPSKTQLQLAQSFKRAGIPVIAYFDALSPVLPGSIGSQFLLTANEFWVPSTKIADAATLLPHTALIRATGQPTLETWKNAFQTVSKQDVRDSILGFKPGVKTVLFAGGYGTGYKESVVAFYKSMVLMPDIQVLISTHPRMGDALEKELLADFPGFAPIFIPASVGTMKAMMISDILVSQNSTVGIQTYFAGRPSIYLDPLKTGYTNFLIESGLSPMLETTEELLLALRKNRSVSNSDPYIEGGIPVNSAPLMAELISNLRADETGKNPN